MKRWEQPLLGREHQARPTPLPTLAHPQTGSLGLDLLPAPQQSAPSHPVAPLPANTLSAEALPPGEEEGNRSTAGGPGGWAPALTSHPDAGLSFLGLDHPFI